MTPLSFTDDQLAEVLSDARLIKDDAQRAAREAWWLSDAAEAERSLALAADSFLRECFRL